MYALLDEKMWYNIATEICETINKSKTLKSQLKFRILLNKLNKVCEKPFLNLNKEGRIRDVLYRNFSKEQMESFISSYYKLTEIIVEEIILSEERFPIVLENIFKQQSKECYYC